MHLSRVLSLVFSLVLLLPAEASRASSPELLKSSGRAERTGDTSRTGSLRLEMSFAADETGQDLSAGATVDASALLSELDGTALVSVDGADLDTTLLEASRGARPDRAKFELPGRDRSGTRIRVTERAGRVRISAQISRARIAAPAACLAGEEVATLRSAITLKVGEKTPRTWSVTQNWKCSERRSCTDCFDLKSMRSSNGHGGNSGNRNPQASIRYENLTRDRDQLNWIRLDGRGSKDRDGEIRFWTYEVFEKQSGRKLYGPGGTSTPVAFVELAPGDYEVLLRVTDDRGAVGTDRRNISISGLERANFGRLGVAWAFGEDWQPGEPFSTLKHAAGLIDHAEIANIFALEPADLTTTSSVARTAAASGNNCGSTKSKGGFISSIVSGVLTIGGAPAAVMLGPEADFPLVIGIASGSASVAGTSLSNAGGNAASSCMQQEIDNLADAVQFQGQQVLQIQDQLDLTDNAFFTAWEAVENAEGDLYNKAFEAEFTQFSPSVTEDSPCITANPNGPSGNCTFTTPGLLGGFMYAAGLWESDTGPAIQGLCNVPGPEKGAIPCDTANELQSYENFYALQTWTTANSSAFQDQLTNMIGTNLGSTKCTTDVWKCLQYDSDTTLIQTLEGLYGNLLGNGGQLSAALDAAKAVRTSGPDGNLVADGDLENIVALIDAYNQALTSYTHQARTVIFEAFQMEWTVNNFNFFANLPAGPVPNNPELFPAVGQLGGAPATYYGGPTDSDYACLNMQQYEACVPNGFVCADNAPLNTGGQACNPSSTGQICGGAPGKCKYPSCKGNSAKCGVSAAEMSAPYNAAQLELAYLYAGRLNMLYELYLRYLVTDLPIPGADRSGLQSWPTYTGTRYCALPATTVASGACVNGGCTPQACTQDSDCATGSCLDLAIDYEGLVTSASFNLPGTGTRAASDQYTGQPVGWIQKANINFDAAPWSNGSNASYNGGSSCVANAGTPASAQVLDGQPGYVNDPSFSCQDESYPWCTGYTFDQRYGQCSDTMPWTATGALYQYALKNPHECRANLINYNRTTSDTTPNMAGAIQSNEDCPSVFATPGGQAPRYGYFDGLTLQPYTFEAAQMASDAEYGCPAECASDEVTDIFTSTAEQQAMACNPLKVTNDSSSITASFEAQGSSCTDGCAVANTCSPLVGLVGGTCPSFVYSDSDSDVSYCVDTGWAQYKRTTALTNCQACVSEPSLLLAGPMLGNVGACQVGTAGQPGTGPKMDWYTPAGMDVTDADNLSMLCEGCTYLGCGNYQPLDTAKLPWTSNSATESDSLPTLFETYGNCSSDGSGVPCTVAAAVGGSCDEMDGYNGDKDNSIMSSVMVNDYRCGYLGGAGVSYIGITNYGTDAGGIWQASLNSDAQSGTTYPWGCGAFGFNTETNSGAEGTTNYASLVFSNPNAVTNLYEAVVTNETQHIAYSASGGASFSNTGQQIGASLVSQCSTNCGAQAPSLGSNTTCLSVATQGNESSMYWLGYACQQGENGESMDCYMNDGRAYSIGFPYGPGGLFNLGTEAYERVENSGIKRGFEFRQANGACPSECSDPEPPGFTFGALAANANGECDGFLSPAGYCGGHCYNQPDIGNNSSTQGPIAVQAPTDCRSCKIARSHGICEPGYVPYAEDGVAGSGCCRQLGFALPFLAFPQSSSGGTTLDTCNSGTKACLDQPCGTIQPDGSVMGTPPAAGTSSCYPWGNTSMWPTWPFTY